MIWFKKFPLPSSCLLPRCLDIFRKSGLLFSRSFTNDLTTDFRGCSTEVGSPRKRLPTPRRRSVYSFRYANQITGQPREGANINTRSKTGLYSRQPPVFYPVQLSTTTLAAAPVEHPFSTNFTFQPSSGSGRAGKEKKLPNKWNKKKKWKRMISNIARSYFH